MATFHFELVSPDKISFSGEVDQVDVPGSEGDFGVLAGHAPLIALLRPGLMTVYAAGEKTELVIFGGFAEVGPDGLTVLADYAASTDNTEFAARMGADVAQLEKTIAQTEPGSELDRLIVRLDHFKALDQHLQGTAMH
jgi:F-type H+-transporting ATPase subunit epsilon